MIRQFGDGVWVDPEQVRSVCIAGDGCQLDIETATAFLRCGTRSYGASLALAAEIGTAARIAQEAMSTAPTTSPWGWLAADTRLHREVPIPSQAEQASAHRKCPECGSAERIGLAFGADGKSLEDCARRGPPPTWPTDDAGRSE